MTTIIDQKLISKIPDINAKNINYSVAKHMFRATIRGFAMKSPAEQDYIIFLYYIILMPETVYVSGFSHAIDDNVKAAHNISLMCSLNTKVPNTRHLPDLVNVFAGVKPESYQYIHTLFSSQNTWLESITDETGCHPGYDTARYRTTLVNIRQIFDIILLGGPIKTLCDLVMGQDYITTKPTIVCKKIYNEVERYLTFVRRTDNTSNLFNTSKTIPDDNNLFYQYYLLKYRHPDFFDIGITRPVIINKSKVAAENLLNSQKDRNHFRYFATTLIKVLVFLEIEALYHDHTNFNFPSIGMATISQYFTNIYRHAEHNQPYVDFINRHRNDFFNCIKNKEMDILYNFLHAPIHHSIINDELGVFSREFLNSWNLEKLKKG